MKIHFYGKDQGDFKSIYNVLSKENNYSTSYNFYDSANCGGDLNGSDFVVTSFNSPSTSIKEIHVGHGYGCISKIYNPNKESFFNDYVKRYFAITVFGEKQKQEYVNFGFPENRVMVIGAATSIELLENEPEHFKTSWLLQKKLNPIKKTILYAPTWNQESQRGLFINWFSDGMEKFRVEKFCDFIVNDLSANLIIRLHDAHRYSQDWLTMYSKIFNKYEVFTTYMNNDPNPLKYVKYSDVLIGDQSSINTEFYIQDKPVVHIGTNSFIEKRNKGTGGWELNDRAGYVTDDFNTMLRYVATSIRIPEEFSATRKKIVKKYIDFIGNDSKEAIIREFGRIGEIT